MKKALSLEQTVNRFLLCVAVWIFLQSIITPRLTALAPMLSALYVPVLQLTRLVSFLIPLRLFLGKPPKSAEIRRPAPSKGTFAGWLLVGLGIYLLIHLLLEVSGLNALTGQSFRQTVSEPIAAYAWLFLFAVLWEEVAFRRYLCGRLVRYDPQLAVLVSALVFAMLHGDLVRSVHSFVFGLLAGFLYLATGRFLCPPLFCQPLLESLFYALSRPVSRQALRSLRHGPPVGGAHRAPHSDLGVRREEPPRPQHAHPVPAGTPPHGLGESKVSRRSHHPRHDPGLYDFSAGRAPAPLHPHPAVPLTFAEPYIPSARHFPPGGRP